MSDVDQIWREANEAYNRTEKGEDNFAAYNAAVAIIAAARVRWQNEALEKAARNFEQHPIRNGWKVDSISSHLRALKK